MKTYEVRTFGCQMNVHDSERLSGLLEAAGYVDARACPSPPEAPDVVVFNTCAVRENADNKLYGNLGQLRPVKDKPPRACRSPSAAAWRRRTATPSSTRRRGSTSSSAPTTSAPCRPCSTGPRTTSEAQLEILESLDVFPSTLPTKRDSAYSGWVSISVGCNNTCTFCIVPALRGKEKDRRPGDILAEVQALVDDGAIEVTLLGQNVNSYGVEFGDRQAFGKLLRACGEIEGLERVRFTSPHPAAFTDDVIDAMAETPNVMPQLHMPLQSGSDRVLKAMRRSYRSAKFLGILDKVRDADPATRRSPPTSSSASPARPRRTSPDPGRRASSPASPPPSPSSTPSAPARRPRRWPTRCPRPWCRSASSGCSPCRRSLLGGEPPARGPQRRGAGRPGRGPQGRRNRTASPAGPKTTGWCTSPCPRAAPCRGPATWSRSPSPTARRTTSSPTPASPGGAYSVRRTRGGDAWAALQDAPQPGRARGHARHAVGRASRPGAHDAARLRLTG